MLAHFVQRNIDGSRNGAEREFLGRTGIYQHHFILLFYQLAPRDDRHSTADNVRCCIAANSDGVFGRGERRRIRVLRLHQIVDCATPLDESGYLVDSLVHSLVTDTLRTIEFTGFGMESQFQGQRQGIRIVTGMRCRVSHRALVFHTPLFQAFGCKTRRGYRHVEYFGNGGADSSFVGNSIAKHHIISNDTSLAVGRICQIIEPGLSGQRMRIFDGIAHSIDVFFGSLQVFVYPDTAHLAQFQAGLLRQCSGRTHTDGE